MFAWEIFCLILGEIDLKLVESKCLEERYRKEGLLKICLFDYLIGMEQWNIRNINRIIRKDPEHKVHLLLEYAGDARDIADPWYTGNFDVTYEDVKEGCEAFLQYLIENEPLY